MNESRTMGNRTPPRERGEWGTERRRENAASGEPNAAARMRRVWNRTPPRERGEWGTGRRRGSAASVNRTQGAPDTPKIQKKETRGAEV